MSKSNSWQNHVQGQSTAIKMEGETTYEKPTIDSCIIDCTCGHLNGNGSICQVRRLYTGAMTRIGIRRAISYYYTIYILLIENFDGAD
jgi:hypothetical protein